LLSETFMLELWSWVLGILRSQPERRTVNFSIAPKHATLICGVKAVKDTSILARNIWAPCERTSGGFERPAVLEMALMRNLVCFRSAQ
jgi:hypothetical protein